MEQDGVVRLERGWGAHHILAGRCRFRRNTLLTKGNMRVVVSTVGLAEKLFGNGFDTLNGSGGYFETMAFLADINDVRYHDIDVERPIYFDSPWSINKIDVDDKANDMHEIVVAEITDKMMRGERL